MEKAKIIEFFDRLAPTWDSGPASNDKITNTILDYAGISEGVSVLDVGCGTGALIPYYLKRGASHVTGIDISEQMIAAASNKFTDPTVSLMHADAEIAGFSRLFDCCVMYNVFPHLPNPEAVIQNLSAFIRTGGILTIAHGGSREHIDSHHMHHAPEVSVMLMSDSEISHILSEHFEVILTISDEDMHQIVGVRK